MKRTTRWLVAMPLAAAVVTIGSATGASAQESESANCVAKFVHGPPGPPGLYQSVFHDPRFGEQVTFVAHQETCFIL